MATHVKASAVIPHNIEAVWRVVRSFTFPGQVFPGVASCTMLDGTPMTVGAVREMKWKTGEMRKHRLLTLSDYHFEAQWEILESVPETETTGAVSTIKLYRITEHDHTLIEWTIDFSSDVKPETLKFERAAIARNLDEIRSYIK